LNLKVTRRTDFSLFISAICGLALLAIYVRSVYLLDQQILPEIFFWVFAGVYSFSILLLWLVARDRRLVLIAVLVSAAVIASLFFLRFYFYGTDFVGEFFSANVTRELGKWTPERTTGGSIWLDWHFVQVPTAILSRYFSTTSVTILPAMLSLVTGLPMTQVFWILVCFVSTTFVAVVFLITRLLFGERIASLSCIIAIFSPFYLGKFPTVLREDIALLFLTLAFFCILKLTQGGEKRLLATSLIFLTVLPMAHYSIVYFAILIFLFLYMCDLVYVNNLMKRFIQRINPYLTHGLPEHTPMSRKLLLCLTLYATGFGILWLLIFAYPILDVNVRGIIDSFEAMFGFSQQLFPSVMQGHVFLSSLGPFNTFVQWMERVLAVVGSVLLLLSIKTKEAFQFLFVGAGLMFLAVLQAALPNASLLFDLDRTMHLTLLFFSVFIATSVLKILGTRKLRKLLIVILLSLFLFASFQLPILYTPTNNLSRDATIFSFSHVIAYYTVSDFQFAQWTKTYTPPSAFFASDNLGHGLCLISNRMCVEPRGANISDTISLLESGKTDYFLLLSYLPDYLAFTSNKGAGLALNSTDISILLYSDNLDKIYDNSRASCFAYCESFP
jgi:hypothetical protein